jgi:GR25 family glycosyltransferase involved in LPS biosynthesis
MSTFLNFMVLNMKKNTDRLDYISKSLNKINCNYTIIEAIDGNNMENNEDVKKIIKQVPRLFGALFQSIDTKKKWIYDGTISKSFPNLNLFGHYGTKGLTISNIKALMIASSMDFEWFCIIEDDAEINIDIYNNILNFIKSEKNKNYDIVLLDARHNGWGGTSAMLYNKRIINKLIIDLHPLSKFSIFSNKLGDENLGNVWDWKLWKYVMYINKNFTTFPSISSGNFISTISV